MIHLKTITFSSFSCFMRSRDAIRIRQHTGLFRNSGLFREFSRLPSRNCRQWKELGNRAPNISRLVRETGRRCMLDALSERPFTERERIGEYLVHWFSGKPRQTSCLLALDSEMFLKKVFTVNSGIELKPQSVTFAAEESALSVGLSEDDNSPQPQRRKNDPVRRGQGDKPYSFRKAARTRNRALRALYRVGHGLYGV